MIEPDTYSVYYALIDAADSIMVYDEIEHELQRAGRAKAAKMILHMARKVLRPENDSASGGLT